VHVVGCVQNYINMRKRYIKASIGKDIRLNKMFHQLRVGGVANGTARMV
jgi:phage-related baseplate assembly protein